jgi:hypothetical protein
MGDLYFAMSSHRFKVPGRLSGHLHSPPAEIIQPVRGSSADFVEAAGAAGS